MQNGEYSDYEASKYFSCQEDDDCADFGMVCYDESCLFKSEIQGERVTAQKDLDESRNSDPTSESKAKGDFMFVLTDTLFLLLNLTEENEGGSQ